MVLNRPYAFVQWVKTTQIPEKYVLMAEPDHVFIRPMPNFMTSESPGERKAEREREGEKCSNHARESAF